MTTFLLKRQNSLSNTKQVDERWKFGVWITEIKIWNDNSGYEGNGTLEKDENFFPKRQNSIQNQQNLVLNEQNSVSKRQNIFHNRPNSNQMWYKLGSQATKLCL